MSMRTGSARRAAPSIAALRFAVALAVGMATIAATPIPLRAMGIPMPGDPPMEPLTLGEMAGLIDIMNRGGGDIVRVALWHHITREATRQALWGDRPQFVCDDPSCPKRQEILGQIKGLEKADIGEPEAWDIPDLTEEEKEALLNGPIKDFPLPPKKTGEAPPGTTERPDVPDAKADYDCSKTPRGIIEKLRHATRC